MSEVKVGDGDEGEDRGGVRWMAVQLALNVDQLSAAVDPVGYQDLVSTPNDSAQMQRDMLTMSGCALVVRGLWHLLGVKHPILEAGYRLQHAVSDLEQIARERGAWRAAADGTPPPKPGDVVLLAKGQPLEHVYTVTGIRRLNDGTFELCSIDGGQRAANRLERIAAFERTWTVQHPRSGPPAPVLWDHATEVDAPDALPHATRPVSGWIDIEAIMAGQ